MKKRAVLRALLLPVTTASVFVLLLLVSCASLGPSGALSDPNAGFANAISTVANTAVPSVVHIDISSDLPQPMHRHAAPGLSSDLPTSSSGMPLRALGSGILISADGLIITNSHVVEAAQEITVHFYDGTEQSATIVGMDKITDIAVIRVGSTGKAVPATFGNSDRLRVGEWVVAIGSPQGLDWTVTAGIVSAMHRQIEGMRAPAGIEDFIQTDSPINPGNSGGPLLNLRGEVIGMNSMIMSQGQGSEGLGFAIPSNLVKDIAFVLARDGKITRGDLGMAVQDLTNAMRRAFKLPAGTHGIVVTEALPLGPAAAASITQGDVIVTFQGRQVTSAADFNKAAARSAPGSSVELGFLRGGEAGRVTLTVADQLTLLAQQFARPGYALLGLRVKSVDSDLAGQIGLQDPFGVVVEEVVPGSPADRVEIAPGDIIFQVGGTDVNDPDEFRQRVGDAIRADNVVVLLRDGSTGRTGYMEVPLH